MPDNLKHNKHVMPADSDHAWRRLRGGKAKPVGCKPELAHVPAEHFESGAAAAERGARTAFGMLDNADREAWHRYNAMVNDDYALTRRIAFDRRAYLAGLGALALGLAIMLGGLYWLYPHRSAPPHITVDNAGWCTGFSHAPSCAKDNERK